MPAPSVSEYSLSFRLRSNAQHVVVILPFFWPEASRLCRNDTGPWSMRWRLQIPEVNGWERGRYV